MLSLKAHPSTTSLFTTIYVIYKSYSFVLGETSSPLKRWVFSESERVTDSVHVENSRLQHTVGTLCEQMNS